MFYKNHIYSKFVDVEANYLSNFKDWHQTSDQDQDQDQSFVFFLRR